MFRYLNASLWLWGSGRVGDFPCRTRTQHCTHKSIMTGSVNKASMPNRKHVKVWLHCQNVMKITLTAIFVMRSARPAAGILLVWGSTWLCHKIFLKAEECTIFDSLRSTATTPAVGTDSTPASVNDSLSAASSVGEEMASTFGDGNGDNYDASEA